MNNMINMKNNMKHNRAIVILEKKVGGKEIKAQRWCYNQFTNDVLLKLTSNLKDYFVNCKATFRANSYYNFTF